MESRSSPSRKISIPRGSDSAARAGWSRTPEGAFHVSPHGARLLMEAPVEPGRTVSYEVPGTQYSGSGTVLFNRPLESPLRVRFVVGLAGQRKPRFAWRFPWSTGDAELKPVA